MHKTRADKVSKWLAEELPTEVDDDLAMQERADFISLLNQPHKSPYRPTVFQWAFVGGAMAVAAVTLLMVIPGIENHKDNPPPPPHTLQSAAGTGTHQLGTPAAENQIDSQLVTHHIVSSPTGEKTIRFDGGSEFLLEAGTHARVLGDSAEQVLVDLTAGTIHADVIGNGQTKWSVSAGPYQVRVTGTVFTVHWVPSTTYFVVSVAEGSVAVKGRSLNAKGIALESGEKLEVDGNFVKISRDDPLVSERSGLPETLSSRGTQQGLSTKNRFTNHPPPGQADSARVDKRVDKWKILYQEKRYDDAVNAAVEQNLEKVISSLGYNDLWLLARAARRANRNNEAYRILNAMRMRFAGRTYAQNATFLLGRMAIDYKNDPNTARQWFEAYLKVNPKGALAEESIGRLISVCKQSANATCAKTYAEKYLSAYPEGTFSQLAHSVLD